MSNNNCPHCHTRSGLNNYWTLLLSLDNLPYIFLYSLIVLAYADRLHMSRSATVAFTVLFAIPLLCRLVAKRSCDNCGAEFKVEAGAKERAVMEHDHNAF